MSHEDWTNAEWAALQIQKHGKDRYPTANAQFIKLVEEIGELGKEINLLENDKQNVTLLWNVKIESADVALALYNLAAKCGFDLDEAIADKVKNDMRKF